MSQRYLESRAETVCTVAVPLSHNLTVLLATEKLKSQD